MKYILRIIIVLALIVGIGFGINHFVNKKDNNEKFIMVSQEAIGQNVKLSQQSNSVLNAINQKFEEETKTACLELINEIKLEQSKIQQAYGAVKAFLPEVYFVSKVSSSSVNNLKEISNKLEENIKNNETHINKFLNIPSDITSVELSYEIERFNNGYSQTRECYVELCEQFLKTIKENVYSLNENVKELNSAIQTINSLGGK